MSNTVAQRRSPKDKYKAIHEVCKAAFDELDARIESIDKKAQTNLMLLGILLGAGIFKLDFFVETFPQQSAPLSFVWISLLICTVGVLLFSVYFSIKTLEPRDFTGYPRMDDIISEFTDENDEGQEKTNVEDFHLSMSDYFRKAWPENDNAIKAKSSALRKAMRLTIPGLDLALIA